MIEVDGYVFTPREEAAVFLAAAAAGLVTQDGTMQERANILLNGYGVPLILNRLVLRFPSPENNANALLDG